MVAPLSTLIGLSVVHPYRCVGQVQRTAVYIDVAGHGTVIIAQIRAPFRTVHRSDIDRAFVVRSPRKPTHQSKN